jgi:peptidoglycan hydrolase-like protein with peptidoglycan-binding domain
VQTILQRLGYDTGPLGEIDSPKLQSAFRQAQRDLGGFAAGLPMHHCWTLQWLRYQTSQLSQQNAATGPVRAP